MSEEAGGVLVMPKAGPRLLWRRQMGTFVGWLSSGANGCICLRRGRWALLQTPASSQNSGRQGRQRRSGLLCWLIWKRPEFSHRTGRQPVPMHFPSLSPGWCGQNLAAWTTLTQPCFFALSNIFYPLVVSFLWCHFFFWIIQIYFIHTQGNFFFIKIFWHDFVCNFTH